MLVVTATCSTCHPGGQVRSQPVTTPTLAAVLTKILIANRGEIAVRVIRGARELGIATVAVYSDLDRDALHVRLADEAYALGGRTAAESYLDTEAILDAIARSGADGVHPGYGFFSENADFARAITEMGVTFIGPPPAAIEEMGDKVSSRQGGAARRRADRARHHRVRRRARRDPRLRRRARLAGRHQGGVRRRRPRHEGGAVGPARSTRRWRRAQREAKAFFGRDEVYVERYLTWPRHVEVQVVGDQHGNVVWVSTRDCSAQRRHQKLIEEAPAPGLPDGVEEAMGAAAVKAAAAVGYTNAGTVEFIYQDGEFFFLEMNTRLQVEHPVTEAITGIDLVEWQIRVASGEPLPMTQDEILAQRRGHAIEVRINAEDPRRRRLPAVAGHDHLARRAPTASASASTPGTRPATRCRSTTTTSIGKLVVWGKDRPTAIARTICALEEMVVEGVATTIPADLAILRHPDFAAVEHSTKWVEERLDLSGVARPTPAVADDGGRRAGRSCAGAAPWRSTASASTSRCGCPSRPTRRRPAGRGGRRRASAAGVGAGRRGRGGGSGDVTVPMQGTIVKVLVEVGQAIERRPGRRRAGGDEDGEPDLGRARRHRARDQGGRRRHRRRWRRASPSSATEPVRARCSSPRSWPSPRRCCTPAGTCVAKRSPDRLIALWGQFFVAGVDRRPVRPRHPRPAGGGVGLRRADRADARPVRRVCLAAAYDHGDFSVAYPIARGSGAALAGLGGILLLGDDLGVLGGRRAC